MRRCARGKEELRPELLERACARKPLPFQVGVREDLERGDERSRHRSQEAGALEHRFSVQTFDRNRDVHLDAYLFTICEILREQHVHLYVTSVPLSVRLGFSDHLVQRRSEPWRLELLRVLIARNLVRTHPFRAP